MHRYAYLPVIKDNNSIQFKLFSGTKRSSLCIICVSSMRFEDTGLESDRIDKSKHTYNQRHRNRRG